MNRTFHSKIKWHQVFYLILLTILCIYLIWVKQAIFATIVALLLVVIIEKIIHTAYVLTADDRLIIKKGRFSRPQIIPLDDIVDVEIKKTSRVGGHAVLEYILLTVKDNKFVGLTPANPKDFYRVIIRKKEHYMD